jgi:hypothetical protein
MQQEGIPPDSLNFVQVLNALANLQAHEEGRHVHKQVTQSDWESNVCVGSSLVDNVCQMWEYGGGLESIPQNAYMQYYLLECHHSRICEVWARAQGIASLLTNAT